MDRNQGNPRILGFVFPFFKATYHGFDRDLEGKRIGGCCSIERDRTGSNGIEPKKGHMRALSETKLWTDRRRRFLLAFRFLSVAVPSYIIGIAPYTTDAGWWWDWLPASTAFLIAVLPATILSFIPRMQFASIMVPMMLITATIYSLALVTTVAAGAAAAGGGLAFAIYVIVVLWTLATSFGVAGSAASGFAKIAIFFVTMNALIVAPWAENGWTIHIENQQLQEAIQEVDPSSAVTPSNATTLASLIRLGLFYEAGGDIGTLLLDNSTVSDVTRNATFIIPSGDFAGVEVDITYGSEQGLSIVVEGGMWVVRKVWTSSGLTNPLAVYQSLLIAMSYSAAILILQSFFPPWETFRLTCRRGIADTLRKAVVILKDAASCKHKPKSGTETLDAASCKHKPKSGTEILDADEHFQNCQNLAASFGKLPQPSEISMLTAFEPYILPPWTGINVMSQLAAISQYTSNFAVSVLTLTLPFRFAGVAGDTSDSFLVLYYGIFERSSQLLSSCATVLETDLELTELSKHKKEMGALEEEVVDLMESIKDLATKLEKTSSNVKMATLESSSNAHIIRLACLDFVAVPALHVGRVTLDLLHAQCKRSWRTIPKHVLPVVTLLVLLPFKLLDVLHSIWRAFRVGLPGFGKGGPADEMIWCIKHTIGISALFAMSYFWEAYRHWQLNVNGPESGESLTQYISDPGPAKYSGWFVLTYIFCSQYTVEGTFKKGLLRLVGTCLGALSGWLALLAFPGSVYGLVSWLGVSGFIALLLGMNPENPILGMDPEFAYGVQLFILTQSIIVAEVSAGSGDRNTLTINRLVATLSGALMSMLMSHIFPLKGSQSAVLILQDQLVESRKSLEKIITDLTSLSSPEEVTLMKKTAGQTYNRMKDALKEIQKAQMYVKDARGLGKFPIYRVPSELPGLLDKGTLILCNTATVCLATEKLLSLIESPSWKENEGTPQRALSSKQAAPEPTPLMQHQHLSTLEKIVVSNKTEKENCVWNTFLEQSLEILHRVENRNSVFGSDGDAIPSSDVPVPSDDMLYEGGMPNWMVENEETRRAVSSLLLAVQAGVYSHAMIIPNFKVSKFYHNRFRIIG